MIRFSAFIFLLLSSVAAVADIFDNPTPADAPALIREFTNPNLRLGASNAIAAIGKPAVPQLQAALRSEQVDVRIWSAFTLGKIGPDASPAAGTLASLLKDSDPHLRTVAARSLGQIRADDAEVIRMLAKSASDDNPRVRQRSVEALGQIGPAAKNALPELVGALQDHSVRARAAKSIVQIGAASIPPVSKALSNDAVRLEAAEILRQLDPAAAQRLGVSATTKADLAALRISLHDKQKDVAARTSAAQELGKLGVDAAGVLIVAFEDNDKDVVRASGRAFQDIGAPAMPLLRETLKHESPQVRAATLDALAAIGPAAKDSVPDVIAALTDKQRDVRHRAVHALSAFESAAQIGIPELIDVMQNPRDLEPTRQLAIKTLVRICPPNHAGVIAALRESAKDRNYGVSSLAKQMLKTVEAKH